MNLAELRRTFRRETRDTEKPYLWSDEEIDFYLNEAQDDAARRSGLLVDSSSTAAASAALVANDAVIELHESVIYVRRARLAGQATPLAPRVARTMDEQFPGWEDSAAGTPCIFVPDWESGKLRLWPPTDADTTALLTVVRTPLSPMVDDEDTPELPPRTHYALVAGAKARAYLKQDSDAFDPKAAERAELVFTAEFGPTVTALDEHWAIEQYYDVGHR